jgi:hypothetical protein
MQPNHLPLCKKRTLYPGSTGIHGISQTLLTPSLLSPQTTLHWGHKPRPDSTPRMRRMS